MDVRFEEYERMCWWLARKAAKRWGGISQDYIGSVYILYAKCAACFKPDMAKFGTFLTKCFFRSFLRYHGYDSDSQAAYHHRRNKPDDNLEVLNFNAYEEVRAFYRIPAADDWCMAVLGCFENGQQFWDWCCRGLAMRDRDIIERRYKHNQTLEQIGIDYKLTRERIRQIEARAMERLKKRVGELERWSTLFVLPA